LLALALCCGFEGGGEARTAPAEPKEKVATDIAKPAILKIEATGMAGPLIKGPPHTARSI
jgi:hypothetical protein